MNEKPILFSAEMIKAILAGTKTQTRRVIKPQPELKPGTMKTPLDRRIDTACWHWKDEWWWQDPQQTMIDKCPYGQPGDRLWVKETWGAIIQNGWGIYLQWRDVTKEYRTQERCASLFYKADDNEADSDYDGCWIPSIFMPRWASRITLEITGVRVERVQEIALADCVAEGIKDTWIRPFVHQADECKKPVNVLRGDFAKLWDSINAKRPGCGWQDNPFVWVIEFKRLETESAND